MKNYEYKPKHIISFLNKKMESTIDIYIIFDCMTFYQNNPSEGENILDQFESVQDSVWIKSHSTFQNTFEVGTVLYYKINDKIIGFISAKIIENNNFEPILYISDTMISALHQGMGLCSLSLLTLHYYLSLKLGKVIRYFLILSGHLANYSFFEKSRPYNRYKEFYENKEPQKSIINFLKKEYDTLKTVSKNGVVRAVFKNQMKDSNFVWNKKKALALGLPTDVNFKLGDALIGFFFFSGDLKWLEEQFKIKLLKLQNNS